MLTISRQAGTGGEVKKEPEDFIVKEITSKGITLELGKRYTGEGLGEPAPTEGKFTTFVLEKRNWDTVRAMLEIAKRTGRGRKSISYAGVKDRRSVSVQLACIYGIEPSSAEAVQIKDISINGAWKSDGIGLGSNLGNGFEITVRNVSRAGNIQGVIEELDGLFPNYFDRQRFGYRLNNFKIGMALLNNNPEEAVMIFLTDSSNETDPEATEARKRLKEEMDFQKALEYFPRHLRFERTMIDHLARYRNFANAVREIQRGIAIMFIHAVEDAVFNIALEDRVKDHDFDSDLHCGRNFYGFPNIEDLHAGKDGGFPAGALIGYETKDEHISEYEKEILERFGITKESFKIRSMPELSMRGSFRQLLSPFKDFSYSVAGEDAELKFSIPSGSYATIFLNEITKADELDLNSVVS